MKTTKKWNKMFLTGMTAKAALVAALAFGLLFIGCGGTDPAPDPVPQDEKSTYTGGSGETETELIITTAADGTKTYVIVYDGTPISSGSVVIEGSTMTFTPSEGQPFTATMRGGIPTFSGEIPKDDGGTVAIPELALTGTTMKLYPFTFPAGSENSIEVHSLDEDVAVGDSYKIHLVGKSDKDIADFYVALNHSVPFWDNLDDYICLRKSITANTNFDITFYLRATKSCDLDGEPYFLLAALAKGEKPVAVDIRNPVTLTLETFTIEKLDGTVLALNPREDWGPSGSNIADTPISSVLDPSSGGQFDGDITAGSKYEIHLVGKSDKNITQFSTVIWEVSNYSFYESSITANTDFDITLTMTATEARSSPNLVVILASSSRDSWVAVDLNNPVLLTLTTFTITKLAD